MLKDKEDNFLGDQITNNIKYTVGQIGRHMFGIGINRYLAD